MRKNYDFVLDEGFVLNAETGKLEEFIPTKISFDFGRECVLYTGLCGGTERTIVEKEFALYKDVASYKSSVAIPASCSSRFGSSIGNIELEWKKCGERQEPWAWSFVDGVVEQVNIKNIVFHYDVMCNVSSNGSRTYYRTGMRHSLKTTLYPNRQTAIEMNDIIVVDKDGKETVRQGLGKRIALNEKQLAARKAFEKAFEELAETGVRIGYDYENDCLFAINHVEGADYDCCESNGYVLASDYTTRLDISLKVYGGCEGFWVKLKD